MVPNNRFSGSFRYISKFCHPFRRHIRPRCKAQTAARTGHRLAAAVLGHHGALMAKAAMFGP